jgi:uncharacterized protein YkwD
MRKLAAIAVALLTFLLPACTPEQIHTFNQINGTREATQEEKLIGDWDLGVQAQLWAFHMASTGVLAHSPNLRDGVRPGWLKLGENVGCGPNLDAIFAAFLASPSHNHNITDDDFTHLGTGVWQDANGIYWVVQRFARY